MAIFDIFKRKESKKIPTQFNAYGKAKTKSGHKLQEALGRITPKNSFNYEFKDKEGEYTVPHRDENSKLYLEVYEKIPVAKSSVDSLSNFAIQTGYELDGSGKEKALKFIDEFNFNNLMLNVLRQMSIYGNAYLEIERVGSSITSLKPLPPDQMYVVVKKGKDDGELVGYKQIVDRYGEPIEFTPDQIAHFKWNEIGPAFYGISDLTSVLGTIEKMLNLRENIGEIMDKYAHPILHHKLGTPESPAQEADIDAYIAMLEDREAGQDLVTSASVDIKSVSADMRMIQVDGMVNHMENQIIAGLGVPEIFVRGGKTSNKATAFVELQSFDRRVKAIRAALAEVVEDKILSVFGDIKIQWREMSIQDESTKATMVKELYQAGVSPETAFQIVGWGNWLDELQLVVPPSNKLEKSDRLQEPREDDYESQVEYLEAYKDWLRRNK